VSGHWPSPPAAVAGAEAQEPSAQRRGASTGQPLLIWHCDQRSAHCPLGQRTPFAQGVFAAVEVQGASEHWPLAQRKGVAAGQPLAAGQVAASATQRPSKHLCGSAALHPLCGCAAHWLALVTHAPLSHL
jgi:hypothetical protein